MHSDWRERVKERFAVTEVEFLDPCEHGLSDPRDYTLWDMEAIFDSDIVFAYLDNTNPSGLGMAAEIGYGIGIKREVVFVDERNDSYTQFLRCMSTRHFETLADGIKWLEGRIK
jgi:hypothetical protein